MAKEFYLCVYEGEQPEKMTDPTYTIGPYKSHEEADDAYWVACFHAQPDEVGVSIFWDYNIEEVGEDDEISCAC